jgi:hypothetical protein
MMKIDVAPCLQLPYELQLSLHSGTGLLGYPTSVRPLLQVTVVCAEYEQVV